MAAFQSLRGAPLENPTLALTNHKPFLVTPVPLKVCTCGDPDCLWYKVQQFDILCTVCYFLFQVICKLLTAPGSSPQVAPHLLGCLEVLASPATDPQAVAVCECLLAAKPPLLPWLLKQLELSGGAAGVAAAAALGKKPPPGGQHMSLPDAYVCPTSHLSVASSGSQCQQMNILLAWIFLVSNKCGDASAECMADRHDTISAHARVVGVASEARGLAH